MFALFICLACLLLMFSAPLPGFWLQPSLRLRSLTTITLLCMEFHGVLFSDSRESARHAYVSTVAARVWLRGDVGHHEP